MNELLVLLPAGLVALGILAVLATDLLLHGRRFGLPTALALLALVAAAAAALVGPRDDHGTWLGAMRPDGFAIAFTVFCAATGVVTVLATLRGETLRRPSGEYLVLVLSAVLGMIVLSSAVDLILLYLAFETVSIPAYVLVGMRRADRAANEASLKYVLFGAVSSALLLYGLTWLVGLSGGTSLAALSAAVDRGVASEPAFLVASVLVMSGFAFKISAVPFHFWAPDVYAGAPAAVGGFLAVASKAAGFAALVRVIGATAPVVPNALHPLTTFAWAGNPFVLAVTVLSVLSMTVGNLGALRQTEVKRLLAWSSIAHAGYLLLAVAVWSDLGAAALLVYLIAYLFMNLAAFLIAGIVIRERGTGDLSAFRGLGRRAPWLGAAFAIVLFSLTGLPPLFGFVGKIAVFYAVFAKGYLWLGVVGLLNGVLSLYYYARVLVRMYLDDADEAALAAPLDLRAADFFLCLALVVPTIVFGVFWGQVWDLARAVVPVLFKGA